MKRAALCLAILVSGAVPGVSQSQDEVLARIRQEALERSHVHALFSTLTDQIGPRLAGTPAYKQSAEWARDRLREFGLADARLDPFPFGRGWVLDRLAVEMVEPRYMPLIGYAEAWSPSTTGEIVAPPVFAGGRRAAEVAAMKDRFNGAIVMTAGETQFTREDRPQPSLSDTPVRIGQPPWVTPRQSQADTRAIAQAVREGGAAVTIRNVATNIVTKTVTNSSGIYYLTPLNPGTYELLVEHSGFRPSMVSNIPHQPVRLRHATAERHLWQRRSSGKPHARALV